MGLDFEITGYPLLKGRLEFASKVLFKLRLLNQSLDVSFVHKSAPFVVVIPIRFEGGTNVVA